MDRSTRRAVLRTFAVTLVTLALAAPSLAQDARPQDAKAMRHRERRILRGFHRNEAP